MGGIEIFVETGDLAAFDLADDRAGQADFAVVLHPASLQHMLLNEAAGKGGQLPVGIFATMPVSVCAV
jgi:hypothetical protein